MNLIKQIKEKHRLITAVKEALDNLPSGVCWFTSSGSVKLCNNAMYDIYRKIADSDLQSFDELKSSLENCEKNGIIRDGNVFIFSDGSAKQYSERKIKTSDGRIYTESVFSNVTELYEKRTELEHQSEKLKNMYDELKALSDNLQEVTREQEILNMKMLLHDQMNMGITAIRQILRQDSFEENDSAITQFRRAIQILQNENVYSADDLSEFLRDAKISGVDVKIDGKLPTEEKILRLIIEIMREACVNAACHSDATVLNIVSRMTDNNITLTITNNGTPPETEIIPRGGLKDIIKKTENIGGKIEIKSLPEFALTVKLPLKNNRKGSI